MKILIVVLFYCLVFFGMFFLLSFFGLVWVSSYYEVIHNPTWFFCYLLFIGWWVAILPTMEISNKIGAEITWP